MLGCKGLIDFSLLLAEILSLVLKLWVQSLFSCFIRIDNFKETISSSSVILFNIAQLKNNIGIHRRLRGDYIDDDVAITLMTVWRLRFECTRVYVGCRHKLK